MVYRCPEYETNKNYLFQFEEIERNSFATNYIGLMSVVDYGYASNHTNCDKNSTDLGARDNACATNNWLSNRSHQEWTITPRGAGVYIWYIQESHRVYPNSITTIYGVRPSMFLDSIVEIKLGEGTKENPYILSLDKMQQ